MASANTQTPAQSAPGVAQSLAQSKFEQGIALILYSWQALTVAVKEEWGGQDSADKRDWFAGVIVDLFITNPLTNEEDLEDLLIQVMEDEYTLVLDDDSEIEIAGRILRIRKECGKGDYSTVDEMHERWIAKGGKDTAGGITRGGPASDDEESVDGESDDEDEDTEMGEASASAPREKTPPQVDEDGFTTVPSRKRR